MIPQTSTKRRCDLFNCPSVVVTKSGGGHIEAEQEKIDSCNFFLDLLKVLFVVTGVIRQSGSIEDSYLHIVLKKIVRCHLEIKIKIILQQNTRLIQKVLLSSI